MLAEIVSAVSFCCFVFLYLTSGVSISHRYYMEVKASITIGLSFENTCFSFPYLTMFFGFVFKLMFSQNGGERCSSGVLMRRAFHKPCALTPCAHSGAGGVASLATSLGPPAGVTAKHINFAIKQTSLWKTDFWAGSLNYIFNTRVSIYSVSKFSWKSNSNF